MAAIISCFFPLQKQQSSQSAHVSPLLPSQPEPELFATSIFQKHIVVFSNVNRKPFLPPALHSQTHQTLAFVPPVFLVGNLQDGRYFLDDFVDATALFKKISLLAHLLVLDDFKSTNFELMSFDESCTMRANVCVSVHFSAKMTTSYAVCWCWILKKYLCWL